VEIWDLERQYALHLPLLRNPKLPNTPR